MRFKGTWSGPAALAAAGALFAACAASPAAPAGVGGSVGAAGAGTGGSGVGGDTMGLKLGTGGPYTFPQSKVSGSCTLTTVAGAIPSTQTAYNTWKNAFLTANGAEPAGSLRVQRPTNSNDTVSEGIGYGMLAAVYMNDRPTFDSLWKYGQFHFNTKGLMSWHLNAGGAALDMGSASDGDVDMIWALIMASDQWSSNDYLTAAANMIQSMRQNSIGPDGLLKPGDTWGGTTLTDPSYFSPAYFRVFAVVVNDLVWARDIIDKNYTILASTTGTNGLVPDWTTDSGVVNSGLLTSAGTPGAGGTYDNSTYGYDASRVPWRITMDWCFNGEVRAHNYLMKVGAFFNGVGAANIVDGYAVTGSPKGSAKNMAFIGPAGVAGMAGFPTLLDAAFTYGASGQQADQAYFPSSLRLISMLMMSGNFIDFTK